MKSARSLVVSALLFSAAACAVDSAPNGLKDTPAGTGPTVQFDLSHRPLPNAPLPNDIATLADPSSRTGLRINASLVAPTSMEQGARAALDDLEGWGTFAPITVSFDRGANSDPRQPAIDLNDVIARMQNDGHDFSNDALYVINLKTGIPAMLDLGDGNFPITLQRTDQYWDNDLKHDQSNLLFETKEEGPGLVQGNYAPALDQDFDGVLDHPNSWSNNGRPGGIIGVDDILSWYERETDTLIVRPLLPLDEKTEYAVVLTDRLRGSNGQPVKSPFSEIYHPLQRDETARVRDILSDKTHANYYGDISGTGLDHVAFVWSYTTAPTTEDLHLLRSGLYGKGPFSYFATQTPINLSIEQAKGSVRVGADEPANWDQNPACVKRGKNLYSVTFDDGVRSAFHDVFKNLFGYSDGQVQALDNAVENIDHVVIGSYRSPFLLGDPASTDIETRFHLDYKTGAGNVTQDDVHFWLVVPKAKAGMKQPFPITFWGHGAGGSDTEAMIYAGDFARQGIATITIDMPEHGIYLSPGNQVLASAELTPNCLAPWVDAIATGRAHDLDGDGVPDSGLFWWTSHIAHTRDVVRQGTLDEMQGVRIMRAFGTQLGTQDFDGDGKPEMLGDFDADGVADVAGTAPIYASGESLGGIMAEILGGIEPTITAAAPMSGGGGLTDIGFRSYGVTSAVVLEQVSPIVFAVPASERAPDSDGTLHSRCTGDQRSVRELIDDGYNDVEVEVACLDSGELPSNQTVLVTNVRSKQFFCARTGADGRFRIPVPSTAGDPLDIQVLNGADLVNSYRGCELTSDALDHVGRRIKTFEQNQITFAPVVGDSACNNDAGCVQFDGKFYDVGSQLLALQDGLGYSRQTPDLRRLRDLAQSGLTGADPIDYAPFYMLKPLRDENEVASAPHALLSIQTVGDGFVPLGTGHAFARAAGALPFVTPDYVTKFPEYADYATPSSLLATYGETPNDVMIDSGETEGAPRLERTHAGPNCGVNYVANTSVCTSPPAIDPTVCAQTLYDADWISEGKNRFDAPHPTLPLRLARLAGTRVTDTASLEAAWAPRAAGVPFSPDASGWNASQKVVGTLNMYVKPQGNHTWDSGDACRAFDFATYGNGMIARFFASGGNDLYYLSHPTTHECLVNLSCPFLQ